MDKIKRVRTFADYPPMAEGEPMPPVGGPLTAHDVDNRIDFYKDAGCIKSIETKQLKALYDAGEKMYKAFSTIIIIDIPGAEEAMEAWEEARKLNTEESDATADSD
jgi:hypothetical protein